MFRRVLIASVCTTMLALAAPATASPGVVASSDRAAAPVKKVVRQYGDGPVSVKRGQDLVLRFKGKRGDRVNLGVAYRVHSGKPYYGTVEEKDVSVQGRHTSPEPDSTGFFRLAESGWFSVRYRSGYNQHLQLLKQVRVTHDGRGTTPLPQRRGYQYAVRVRAPQSGLRVVSFGTDLFGVVSGGRYNYNVDGEALVVSPGLPVFDGDYPLSKALRPRQQVVVMIDPSESGEVVSSVPTELGKGELDGRALALPGGGTQAVIADVEATDLAASAERLLNVRVIDEHAQSDWTVVVLTAEGSIAEPAAPAYSLAFPNAAPLLAVSDTSGTYRVLAFPSARSASAAQFELDSVADGGSIAVDAPAVTVPARPDGRYTLLTITQPEDYALSYLSVSDVTVPAPWAVYAGRLTVSHCGPRDGLGCGEGNGVGLTSAGTGSQGQYGGYVLTMPTGDQASGAFTVKLSTTYVP